LKEKERKKEKKRKISYLRISNLQVLFVFVLKLLLLLLNQFEILRILSLFLKVFVEGFELLFLQQQVVLKLFRSHFKSEILFYFI